MNKKNHKNLVLSFDDFGASSAANKSILKLITHKKNSRVSIMVDGKISPLDIDTLKQSGAKLDLHLTIAARNPYSQKKTRWNH